MYMRDGFCLSEKGAAVFVLLRGASNRTTGH